jgi:hypothetical protein
MRSGASPLRAGVGAHGSGAGTVEGVRQLCMAATLRARGGPCGISSTTWQAVKWSSWSPNLGLLWADLGLRPKTKVEAHTMLYISYLGVIVIRAVD